MGQAIGRELSAPAEAGKPRWWILTFSVSDEHYGQRGC